MKVIIGLILVIHVTNLIVIANAVRSAIYAPLNLISLKDITLEERRQIAYLEQKLERAKRSGSSGGSGEIFNYLKSAIGNGIKNKVGQLASASAAASGSFSKTSSSSGGGHDEYYHHHPPPPHHHYEEHHSHNSLDFWDLKKSILNTLLQAVKAIKGGVLAVKGQLVKGGGKLVSASGSLISSQGDSITELGKNIATSAILVPWMGSSAGKGHPHVEYAAGDHHYSAPSAPEEIYHHPPPSTHHHDDYHVPDHYPHHHRDGAAGLLILKKISPQDHHNPHHDYSGQHYDHSAPVHVPSHSSPGLGAIVGEPIQQPHYQYEQFNQYFR